MSETGKRGSSLRKGFEYQDITALSIALNNYIINNPFEMFLEYEKSGNLDDILIFQENSIIAYQVKYAINPLDVYVVADFTDPKSKVSLKKFADSWKILREQHPDQSLTICLCSNRGLDANLLDLVTPEGQFTQEVIKDTKRGDAKKLRSTLASASGLDPDSFSAFLANFKFVLRQPTLKDIEQYIRTVLLEKELGLSEDAIFLDLRDAIKNNAILSREAITLQSIDSLLTRLQSKLLIPQVFPVKQDHFVEQKTLSSQLDHVLSRISGKYLIITGFPGSGKSTSLTTYFDALSVDNYEVFKYYCFVGVNDNAQRMRVKAESLRANLISEFHRRYPQILKRRFDYSERNFLECLTTLAKYFVSENRRFIILLDGLDHAERLEPEVRETVISALPFTVPEGVTIVIGTQELHNWPFFLKCAIECPDSHIKMPLFSETETQNYLVNKRGISGLLRADIVEIQKKCEGLPLYLKYAAEILISGQSLTEALASLAPASGGDIRNYYEYLWNEFERAGRGNVKHLCAVMACLRFSVHRDELSSIVGWDRPTFEDAYKCINHLLRNSDDRLTVFHNSFRDFVINQVNDGWVKEIRRGICTFLKGNKDKPKWFEHVFKYCYDAEDYTYVLDEINTEFVDRALKHCRPSIEILDGIHWAIESAFKQNNIVQLSHLGALKYRTNERLKYELNRSLLSNALIALGREQDVISFAYSLESDHWLVDNHTSLAVMSTLAEKGRFELGKKLFNVFTQEFRGIQSNERNEERLEVIGIARCLGIYNDKQVGSLRWLSENNLIPGELEQKDIYAPGYAPHMASYINALVQFGYVKKWRRLKRIRILFQNNIVRYLLIRALAHHNLLEELRIAVTEYIRYNPGSNVELAFYAAKSGMSVPYVSGLAGTIEAPKIYSPENVSLRDPILKHYAYSFIVMAYEGNDKSYSILCNSVGKAGTLWVSALQHLLKACHCIGLAFRSVTEDWYKEANDSITILVQAKKGETEKIFESIDLIRNILPFTIGNLTEQVQKCFPERLNKWIDSLASLRDSLLWTTHFGIMEFRRDYNFELKLWEALSKIPAARPRLAHILISCAQTYKDSTTLKGGCRSDHFLRLSAIMAECGMKNDAETWLLYGIRASLIYGYHKDITLLYLIDILKMLNQRHPENGLERCSRVLSMVKWMPQLTDNRETKWFVEKAFEAVLEVNRMASFDLLKHFSQNTARWQMQDCLESYILSASDGDPEYLWCLTELFANHFNDDGRHCKQILDTRQHIINLVKKFYSEEIYLEFEKRYRHFILTEITPRHWPENVKKENNILTLPDRKDKENTNSEEKLSSKLILDSINITKEEIVEKCRVSFSEFLIIIKKLKNQNHYFHDSEIIETALLHHINCSKSLEDLIQIKIYVENQGRWQNSDVIKSLANRFIEFGDQDKAIACFGIAYSCYGSFFYWKKNAMYLEKIVARDKHIAKAFILKECYESTQNSSGCNTPPIAATGLDVLNETKMLNDVFNDFLTHCESMFVQLPKNEDYSWLKDYKKPSVDENQLILNFVVDEFSTSEIDHRDRLIMAVSKLAIARPINAIPILISRLGAASGRILRCLLTVFDGIASQYSGLLESYQQAFAKLLEREDFFCRQTILHILRCVNEISPLEESVASNVQRIERNYSSNIYYSTYRMPSNPSPEFIKFLKKNTLFNFTQQLMLMEKILQLPLNSLVAAIEERLISQKWSMDDERIRVKDDWDGHVHPQGWPVVWITTEFQELVTNLLWSILNEAVEKLKLKNEQINWLWHLIQPADPEYIFGGIKTRPQDIYPLRITDKQTWFNELDTLGTIQIDSKFQGEDGDWITVFETRELAQEEKFNVPYRQKILHQGFLIQNQIYGRADRLAELELITERIVPESLMSVTIQQAKIALHCRGNNIFHISHDCIPIIAVHKNPSNFMGYSSVCSLASFIIKEFNLTNVNGNLIKSGKVVSKFEAWQEGYQDESYTREKLSVGVRFQVHRDFLIEICRHYHKILCICINENRSFYKSIYDHDPDDIRDTTRYVLYHLC